MILKRTFILFFLVFTLSACVNEFIKSPDAELFAYTPAQVSKWADQQQDNNYARLYVIRSDNMRGLAEFLVKIGIIVPFIKTIPDDNNKKEKVGNNDNKNVEVQTP